MDKFEQNTMITLTVIVLALLAFAYIGYIVGGNQATDDLVNSKASGTEESVYYNPFTVEPWGDNGEYVGFFAAGCLGGFVVGYLLPTVFGSNTVQRRKDE